MSKALKLVDGGMYRGKSGAIYRVESNPKNTAWPFKTADEDHITSRFWREDGEGYNTDGWNSRATTGDDLVAVAFKVGDRVRHKTYVPDEVGTIRTKNLGGSFQVVWTEYGESREWAESLVAHDPATLTIQAGRYYKTRDGRKVGPMVADGEEWSVSRNDGRLWLDDGSRYTSGNEDDHLIAEWTDEPVVAEATTADIFDEVEDWMASADFTPTDDGWSRPPAAKAAAGRKFPVGSRVVRSNGLHDDTGTVVDHKDATHNTVEWDDGEGDSDTWQDYELTFASTPSIVAAIENGQPLPARKPFVHGDRDSALREAARLAKMHAGKEFGVYELVSTAKEAKVYDFEWQRLAAEGQKINAIKELRRMAGVCLLSAKNAVEHIELTRAA